VVDEQLMKKILEEYLMTKISEKHLVIDEKETAIKME
jgi:hypothetical protein